MEEDEDSLFKRPVPKSLLGFGGFVLAYIFLIIAYFVVSNVMRWGPPANNLLPVGDFFLCAGGLAIWGMFFAQFVLPVNKIEGRWQIVEHLVIYVMARHGPAIFIENGIVRAAEGEMKKRGRGVMWLDSASAAVLRTPVKFTRVIGPGVHFTTAKETIAATVDLHTLTHSIGPDDKDQPYAVLDDVEKQKALQARSDDTKAFTRDDVEVLASISVTFRIRSTPGEGGTRFGFDAENVRRAVTESLLQGVQTEYPVWSTLPTRMAADVWREYVRKFKFGQLFETLPGGNDTALQVISALLKKRLTQETVEVWDDYGHPKSDSTPIPSQEFARLRDMGLEVVGVNLKRVIFKPAVEDKLISQWSAQWLKNAQREREQVESNYRKAESVAREEALKDFAIHASHEISHSVLDHDAKKIHALEMLVHSTFLGVRRTPVLLKRANAEQRDLAEIFRWLRKKRGENSNDIT